MYPSLGMCIRVCVYPSCTRSLVAKKFGCKRAHINEYDNNTHEAGQSRTALRGAGGRNSITRLTSTYDHGECIQIRRLGPPPLFPSHTGCGRTSRERLLGAGSRYQNSWRTTDEERADTRPAQGPTRAEGSRATGIDMAYCKQPLPPRHRP